MKSIIESSFISMARRPESEGFPELVAATNRSLESGDALEAYRAFDDGALAEVPRALEAYISHQRFNLA